jgi:hypothetical protein
MSRARRLQKFAYLGLKILVGAMLGVLSILVLALFSLRFEPVRAFAAAKTNALLEPSFRGRLVIQRIGLIDFGGVGGVDLEVLDPSGKSVLRARGAAVSLSVPGLAYDAVFGDAAPLVVHIDRTSVETLEVTLIDDGTGSPTLVRAFEPKEPSPPSTEPGYE